MIAIAKMPIQVKYAVNYYVRRTNQSLIVLQHV